jgi:hypothetical protein
MAQGQGNFGNTEQHRKAGSMSHGGTGKKTTATQPTTKRRTTGTGKKTSSGMTGTTGMSS